MSLKDIYAIGLESDTWTVPQEYEACFNFAYDDDRQDLLALYEKGKRKQWNAKERIDWSQDLDFENPMMLPEHLFALYGFPLYEKMSEKEKIEVRRHMQAWNISQFMQGEQGALLCASKIVLHVPSVEAKFYASTQVVDEARHVEAYKMLLQKFGIAYPMTDPLKNLLDQVLRDNRWDMTYLGMQVVIEGLALAAFAGIRDNAQNPLAASVNAYVMEDEARHVAFGRLALREYYPQLSDAERKEREEFLVEACYFMRDRFEAREVWTNMGLPADECIEYQHQSEGNRMFRNHLFSRIVPIVKDIGLWGPTVQKGYTDMGVLDYADIDVQALQEADENIAEEFDARREHVHEIAAMAGE